MRLSFLIATIALVISCTKSDSAGQNSTLPNGTATPSAENPIPSAPGTGTLTIKVSDTQVDLGTVQGYVVGSPGDLQVQRLKGNDFAIKNVPPGPQDLILTAGKVAVALNDSAATLGLRKNKIVVVADSAVSVPVSSLPPMGDLSGKAILSGQSDFAGIDVYIPGTTYIAKTDTDGRYDFALVPVGTHKLFFDKDGYGRGILSDVEVRSAVSSVQPDVTLVLSTGASGSLTLAGGADTVSSKDVDVVVTATANAVLMMISEDPDFTNVAWQPIKTCFVYTFTSGGTKKLYARFADANGLESTPVLDTIQIDLNPPSGGITLNSGDTWSTSRTVTVNTGAVSDEFGNPAYMMLSESQTFAAATWMPFTANPSFELSSGDGNKTVYAKFKDAFDHASAVVNDSIALDTTAPSVTSSTPAASASAVDKDSFFNVTLGFSEPLSPLTVSTSTVRVKRGSTVYDFTPNLSSDQKSIVLMFNPTTFALLPGTTYTVEVNGVRDLAGNSLANYTQTFTTGSFWSDATILRSIANSTTGTAIPKLESIGFTANAGAFTYQESGAYYAVTYAGGGTFSIDSPVLVDSAMEENPTPEVTPCGSKLVFTWTHRTSPYSDIYTREFDGTNWTTASKTSDSVQLFDGKTWAIACSSTLKVLAWTNWTSGIGSRLYAALDTGSGFSAPSVIHTFVSEDPAWLAASVVGNKAVLTWLDINTTRVLRGKIYDGSVWQAASTLSGATANRQRNYVAADGKVQMSWTETTASCPSDTSGSTVKYRSIDLTQSSPTWASESTAYTGGQVCNWFAPHVRPVGTSGLVAVWDGGQAIPYLEKSLYNGSSWSSASDAFGSLFNPLFTLHSFSTDFYLSDFEITTSSPNAQVWVNHFNGSAFDGATRLFTSPLTSTSGSNVRSVLLGKTGDGYQVVLFNSQIESSGMKSIRQALYK